MIDRTRYKSAGFTLTEMAIVLTVVGVLVAGLWNLISGANQQSRDAAAANQQVQLINAVKEFLASPQGQNYMINNMNCGGNCGAGSVFSLPLPDFVAADGGGSPGCSSVLNLGTMKTVPPTPPAGSNVAAAAWCAMLPSGFWGETVNSYGQTYSIQVMRDSTPNPNALGVTQPPNSYSFMVLTGAGATISDTSGARISALIGGDGGFIYTNPVCTAAASSTTACGSYGGWIAGVTGGVGGYGFPAGGFGNIASRTYVSPQLNATTSWLARVVLDAGTYSLNTMMTPEYLGSYPLIMGSYNGTLPPQASPPIGGEIDMGNYATATGGGYLNLEGGSINFNYLANTTTAGSPPPATGTMNMQGGTIYLQGGLITNNATATADGSVINLNGPMKYTATAPPATMTVGNGGTCFQTYPPSQGTLPYIPANGPTWGPPYCQVALQVNGDANITGTLSANGLYAGTFIYQASDIRLKTNIQPIQNPLIDIMRLKPVSFTLKASGKKGLGVIAQDIEKVYPQLVSEGEIKSVNYDGLIGPLIGAVQELEKENTILHRQMEQQESRQKKLEEELNNKNRD